MRKRTLGVLAFAFAHVLVTVWLSISAYGAAMQDFDGGEAASPRVLAFLIGAAHIASWPLALIRDPNMSGAAYFAMAYANGLIWAVAVLCAYLGVRRFWPHQAACVTRIM